MVFGAHESALGDVWHVPDAETLTTREFVALACEVAGTDPTVGGLPTWLLTTTGYADWVSSRFTVSKHISIYHIVGS